MITATEERNGQSTSTERRFDVKVEPSETKGREILKVDVECEFESTQEFNDWVRACVDRMIVELAMRERILREG